MKYFILSGLALRDNNRGTAALGYGAFSFLEGKGFIKKGDELLTIKGVRNIFKIGKRSETIVVQGKTYISNILLIPSFQTFLARRYGIFIPFTRLWRYLKNTSFVAAINGGDGFSDIYGDGLFYYRLPETLMAMKIGIPVIQLPQTFGPFEKNYNYIIARKILQYSSKVYVRDNKFVEELDRMGVKYEETKDLSAFMKPEPWDIDISPNSIGINISGLCYSNSFKNLEGQFDSYPELIDSIITHFQKKNKTIYLIPHSYNYTNAEQSNDDMVACRQAYKRLKNKDNVILIDKDMTSPQIKYIISKMSFFIGTRMHANFAAIYSGVPVFGIAYSYKFEGAFNANNLNGKEQTFMINNLAVCDIPKVIEKIEKFYISQQGCV